MFYDTSITIDANTSETSPKEVFVPLAHGVITRVIVRPRPGHHALAHLKIYHENHQLYPTNLDGDLHGDTFPIEWDDFYEIFDEPYEIVLRGWNEDTLYSHTFDVGIALLPKWVALPYAFAKALGELASLLSPRRLFGGGK